MDLVKSNKKKKKTPEEILQDLEENGLDLTPEGLGPWSHSKLKMLKNCPLQFYLQYILKRLPESEKEISLITEVGKAAHRILEFSLGGKSITDSYKLTRKEFQDTISDQDWEENIVAVEFNIIKFNQKIAEFEKQYGVKRILQELRIGCNKDWEASGFFADDVYFRGVIDLVIQLENNDIIIVDHKYGTTAAAGLRNFQDQLNTYKVLFHHGINPVEGAQSGIHHIREGEVVLDNYSEKTDIEGNLVNLIELSIDGAIEGVKDLGKFKHKAGNSCKYCDYRVECKAGRLKDVEESSKKWFEIKKE